MERIALKITHQMIYLNLVKSNLGPKSSIVPAWYFQTYKNHLFLTHESRALLQNRKIHLFWLKQKCLMEVRAQDQWHQTRRSVRKGPHCSQK